MSLHLERQFSPLPFHFKQQHVVMLNQRNLFFFVLEHRSFVCLEFGPEFSCILELLHSSFKMFKEMMAHA